MNTKLKLLVGATAAALVVAGATVAGLANADTTASPEPNATQRATPSTHPTARPSEKQGRPGKYRRVLGRAIHGEATLGGKEHRIVVFQRGEVTEISGTKLEVRSIDGYTATYAVDAEVRVRVDRERGELGDVKAQQKVRVLATKDGENLTAKRIVVVE